MTESVSGMSKFIDAMTMIALALVTFLWYRKGRLWNFYDSFLLECSIQIKEDSLDRERWEQIALEQCAILSKDTFQSLFRFEVEYLGKIIVENQYKFWIPDSTATNEKEIKYTDKGQYCKSIIAELFQSDFRFCGLGLFVNSLKFHFRKNRESDAGYVEIVKNENKK